MKRVTTTEEAQKLVRKMELEERAIRGIADVGKYLVEWEGTTPEIVHAFECLEKAIFGGYDNEV